MYKNLNVGDKFYLPFSEDYHKNNIMIDKGLEFVVLGKDINPNPGEKEHFIDVMSMKTLSTLNEFWLKKEKIDKYGELQNMTFLKYSNSDIAKNLQFHKQYLPKEIQDAIIPRQAKFLTKIDLWHQTFEYEYKSIGNIWLPSLHEVCGVTEMSDDCPENQQYPYFEDPVHRQLDMIWWLRSTRVLDNRFVYLIDFQGDIKLKYADSTNLNSAPLCFRLKL